MLQAHSIPELTARDLMTCSGQVIPDNISFRAAAHLLILSHAPGLPVVDADGRCLGLLSTDDFVRWTKDGAEGVDQGPPPPCPNQEKGRLLNGDEGLICTLAAGSCPWQDIRPTIAGGHSAICTLPAGAQREVSHAREPTETAVRRYMRSIIAVSPDSQLSEVVRAMVNSHSKVLVVADADVVPLGIVAEGELLAAVTRDEASIFGANKNRDDALHHVSNRLPR